MEKEITNKDLADLIDKLAKNTVSNTESIDIISKTTLKIFETMATKEDLKKTDQNVFNIQQSVNSLETDLKSFKEETNNNFKKLNENFGEDNNTIMNHDKRIEKLETKVFGSIVANPA